MQLSLSDPSIEGRRITRSQTAKIATIRENPMSSKSLEKKVEKPSSINELKENLFQAISEKNAYLADYNEKNRGGYPLYIESPVLLRKIGEEITHVVRKNFDKLIQEAGKYSELGEIPPKQKEMLHNIISTNRIFIARDEDHDRARIEFDLSKYDLQTKFTKEFGIEWPKHQEDIFCNDMLYMKNGKAVSRHHFLPVRAVLVKEGSALEKDIDSKKIDFKSPLLNEHYAVNDFWNLIPSKCPKEHLEGIHKDSSVFSKVFGPILADYHYTQPNPKDDTKFNTAIPVKNMALALPEFVREYDFYLKKLEKECGVPIHDTQKTHAYNYLTRFVNSFPESNLMRKASYSQILDDMFTFHFDKKRQNFLKDEWQHYTGQKWPEQAKFSFLIPPYYKINNLQWWMVHPKIDKNIDETSHHDIAKKIVKRPIKTTSSMGGIK